MLIFGIVLLLVAFGEEALGAGVGAYTFFGEWLEEDLLPFGEVRSAFVAAVRLELSRYPSVSDNIVHVMDTDFRHCLIPFPFQGAENKVH